MPNTAAAAGLEETSAGFPTIAAKADSPRKMGPQIAKAQPAGDTKPRDQCARGIPAGSCVSVLPSALAAFLAAITRLASSAISPSTRPGMPTLTTFTANAPTLRICQPLIPNAGTEASQPEEASFARPTARPPAAATIAPTAASRASTMSLCRLGVAKW